MEREREIAQLCGTLNATTGRLVRVLGEVLGAGDHEVAGIHSAEQWVAWKCGVSSQHAHRLVTMARALADLPVAAAAFTEGALTEDQTHVVCRHVDADHDEEATALARGAPG